MKTQKLFIQETTSERIKFTSYGINSLGEKFAKAGFDIREIRTMTEFERAVDASF